MKTPRNIHHIDSAPTAETRPRTRARRKLVMRRARAWARFTEWAEADRVLTVDAPAGCERADARHEAECAEYQALADRCLEGLTPGELAWSGRALGTPRWYGGRDYPAFAAATRRTIVSIRQPEGYITPEEALRRADAADAAHIEEARRAS